jgi:syntaxin 18
MEISELHSTLASNLSMQETHINQLIEDSFNTTENVGSGNKELKRATERGSTAQKLFWATSIFCTTLVVWDLFI